VARAPSPAKCEYSVSGIAFAVVPHVGGIVGARYDLHMRVYKFLDKHFGLKSLYERRLKQSRIHELNDPFELTPYDLTDPAIRHAFFAVRESMGRENGLICFSASWQDPVIWAHYAEKHQGICLGFEIPAITGDGGKDIAKKVTYVSRPLRFPPGLLALPQARQLRYVDRIPFTKFKHWAYEKEVRVWGRLSNEEDGLHFFEFERRMKLVEVRVGANCTISRSAIMRAIDVSAGEIRIIKVRAACNRFAMVQDDEW
jgi:hypothetical protein